MEVQPATHVDMWWCRRSPTAQTTTPCQRVQKSECGRVVLQHEFTMGVDWSKQCQAASSRPLAERMNALHSSYYSLVATHALIAVFSFFMLVNHLRSRVELWRNYARFLGLTCAGCVLGEVTRLSCCARRKQREFYTV